MTIRSNNDTIVTVEEFLDNPELLFGSTLRRQGANLVIVSPKTLETVLFIPRSELVEMTIKNSRVKCDCGEDWVSTDSPTSTLVGYFSPPGHNHDDNCIRRNYTCINGHTVSISIRNKCHSCDWKGIEKCPCHSGLKVDRWPEVKV